MIPITSDTAPKAIGPYSHAIQTDSFLFCSGQVPLKPSTMDLVDVEFSKQAHQVFKNVLSVLKSAQLDFSHVVKVTVFLTDMNDFHIFNKIYEQYIIHKPARSVVQVVALPKKAQLEVDVIAEIKN